MRLLELDLNKSPRALRARGLLLYTHTMKQRFKLHSKYKPAGDQPSAIKKLVNGIEEKKHFLTLLGATGTGKTFTIANVVEQIQKPTLVIAHNKTLAAQLAGEFQQFFPENAVHYFVSYYDYYQPEAYISATDTFIEKEAMINKEIDRLRHAATQSLLTRDDVLIVASVSAIYGIGNPSEYAKAVISLSVGDRISRAELIRKFISLYFERTNADLEPGKIRATGSFLEVHPANEEFVYRIKIIASRIANIEIINAITREVMEEVNSVVIFPAKHFVTSQEDVNRAIEAIKVELKNRVLELKKAGKELEAQRLLRRTNYDLALIREVGYCNGIENYSRHFDGRLAGEPPHTLLSYFKRFSNSSEYGRDFLTVIDESHVTLPQISGMYAGDLARKNNLVEYGFRLPSARDNRPLRIEEFLEQTEQIIFVSATPGEFEKENGVVIEQIIRPTGLVDPEIIVRPIVGKGGYPGQIKDFIKETEKVVKSGARVLVTTLTKKMAEDLSEFLTEKGIRAEYIHSEIKTFERVEIMRDFRRGEFDVLVGVNLLREGLDLPEVELVAILDADKEGFLRSETSLIQTIGRAARNVSGKVILYADIITKSMKSAINETNRRRKIQNAYNKKHNITPRTIKKEIYDVGEGLALSRDKTIKKLVALDTSVITKKSELKKLIKDKRIDMKEAAKNLDFETAALLRDEIYELELKLKT